MTKKTKLEILNIEIEEITLSNGLKVLMYANENIDDFYAEYSVDFGNIDLQIPDNNFTINPGSAHFLEHIMFAGSNFDYFEKFNKLGASANAYTSNEKTAYLFSTANKFEKNLEVLIEMVQSLTINNDTITKERSIINEEIDMYFENPDFRAYYELNKDLYTSNYRFDIAGKKSDISDLEVEYFHKIFDYYYHPANCKLFLAGPFNLEKIKIKLEEIQLIKNNKLSIRKIENNESVKTERVEKSFSLPAVMTEINLGAAKVLVNGNKEKRIENVISFDVFFKLMFSNCNNNFENSIINEIINDSFCIYNLQNKNINVIIYKVLGKSNTNEVVELINTQLENFKNEKENIKKQLRGLIGSELRSLDSASKIIGTFTAIESCDFQVEEYYDVLSKIKPEDIIDSITNMEIEFNNYINVK